MKKNKISRRKFFAQAGCAALGTSTFFSGVFNLGMANELSARALVNPGSQDYKALVCVFLAGGNDSFNMLVPRENSSYNEYSKTRSNQALKKEELLNINASNNVLDLGLHPAMNEVKDLFDQSKLTFINNVGALIQPTRKLDYDNEVGFLPVGLFSHADQAMHWQTALPQSRSGYGWGGRMADILQSMNSNQKISMNISLAGRNIFQSGRQVSEYTIRNDGNGSTGILGYEEDDDFFFQVQKAAVDSMMEKKYQDVFTQTYADVVKDSQNTHELFSLGVGGVNLNTQFSNSKASRDFNMIAKTIGARDVLGVNRQVFFIQLGEWDHHDELKNAHTQNLNDLSKGLGEFNSALEELGVQDQVTTFTISDFGRTLTSNGNGTDHGWGGNAIVMGGAVNGGRFYGEYPDLSLNNPEMLEGGVVIPTTSSDEYFAEIAQWFGVSNSELSDILPNLTNFYSPGSQAPIGFMNI